MNNYYAMDYNELKRRRDSLWTKIKNGHEPMPYSGMIHFTEMELEDLKELTHMERALTVIGETNGA
jgi:hypothetical protein